MTEANVSPRLLRLALEEDIRMGPETRRSVEERVARRARGAGGAERAAALEQAGMAVAAAEAMASQYQKGERTQADVYAELRCKFPWLAKNDLAVRLGDYGFHLVIM
jgi:hypothetical protein